MKSRHPSKILSDSHSGPANLGPQMDEQDYSIIFSNSNASSIPFLHLPQDTHFLDFSGSELDYSHVFRGLNDDQAIGVSYQDLKISFSSVRSFLIFLISLLFFSFLF